MQAFTAKDIDGKVQTFKVGQTVGFKSDIEQYGKITKIEPRSHWQAKLHLENKNGFDGGYIGGDTETWALTNECWID